MLFTNPVFISVILMTLLCLFRFNVLLSILISGLAAGVIAGFSLIDTMNTLVNGMKDNLQTALSYILLGAIAAAIAKTNLTAYLIKIVSNLISKKRLLLVFSLAIIACFSQNLVPIHVAFIPILIPPLLFLFNKLKIDRRGVACALTFGLTTPYMVLPLGFGLIFQNIIVDNLAKNGINISLQDVTHSMSYALICMLIGLFLSIFVFYSKKREYKQKEIENINFENLQMGKKEWGVLIGLIVTLALQLYTQNLPLSGLLGFTLMVILGGVEYKKIDFILDDSLKMMGYIAFVMLVAAGYAEVLKNSGGIDDMVNLVTSLSNDNKFFAVFSMLLIGLIITMGIGTSFGTIPIIAALFCPICLALGMNASAIIFVIGVAGALGDAGSPASETTLGVTMGLNADKQHDHIRDTCIPTFLFYNIPLLFIGSIIAAFVL